ncbi:DUF6344 domain-containing protein [Streptomyces sp. NPDC051041]|uniref:DUF6344 domain-containing protein n=1 Tax=Streptomyces sp. NPDC051041 TaxID=3365640 RepID=UPI003791D799
MARNKVMKLWTVVVTAFLALCAALGIATTTATAAVPQTETARNSDSTPLTTAPAISPRPSLRSLPPTMKQRIRAEAHGKAPRCRHSPLTHAAEAAPAVACAPLTLPAPRTPAVPLQR